ncbi:hypothetical protein ACREZT_08460, partial [Streptococcus pneumoniae]
SSKKHPLGEKRNHPGSKLRQGFWMVFRLGVNNWGSRFYTLRKSLQTASALSATSKQCFEQPAASFLVCSLIFIEL